MTRLKGVTMVGAVTVAGLLGLAGHGIAMQRLSDHCFGHEWDSGTTCCQPGETAYETGIGDNVYCVGGIPGALPGAPPSNPPPTDPGGGGGGGGGGGRPPEDRDPPECKPGQHPFPPSGKLVGAHLKPGEVVELTDGWLRNHPEVEYVEYTPEETDAFQAKIDEYVAQQQAQPKPKCKETCKSCKADRDAKIEDNTRSLKRCQNTFKAVALSRCKAGLWRADPRDPNEGWGCNNGIGYTPECGYPGTPVQEKDCTEEIDNGRVVWRQCTLTMAMSACIASWMDELPSSSTGHTGPGGGIDIGPVKTTAWGGTSETVTLQGRDGFKDACEHWSTQNLLGTVAQTFDDCIKRVETATGAKCD